MKHFEEEKMHVILTDEHTAEYRQTKFELVEFLHLHFTQAANKLNKRM